jgi:hypothetical protein
MVLELFQVMSVYKIYNTTRYLHVTDNTHTAIREWSATRYNNDEYTLKYLPMNSWRLQQKITLRCFNF